MVTGACGSNRKSATLELLGIGRDQVTVDGAQPILRGKGLVPIRIKQGRLADGIEPGALFGTELELGGEDVVPELVVTAPADDHRSDTGPAQQPGQRDLGAGDAALPGHRDDDVDDV